MVSVLNPHAVTTPNLNTSVVVDTAIRRVSPPSPAAIQTIRRVSPHPPAAIETIRRVSPHPPAAMQTPRSYFASSRRTEVVS